MKKAGLRTVKTYKWTVHFHDRKGKHFYYNRDTGKSTVGRPTFCAVDLAHRRLCTFVQNLTQWTKPDDFDGEVPQSPAKRNSEGAASRYSAHPHRNGKTFYHDSVTGKSTVREICCC